MASATTIEVNDLTLFLRMKSSEESAFKELFLRYYDKLHQFITLTHHDPILAEEVVQEVFVRLWERRQSLEIHSSVKYYLYSACRNQAYNLVSQKRQYHQRMPEAMEAILVDSDTPETVLSSETLYQDLQRAVDALPVKAKKVFVLKYFQQSKHKEIAREMNISESMVEKHAANALRHLRKKLASHDLSVILVLLTKLPLLIPLVF